MSNITVLQEVFDHGGVLQDVWEARFEGASHLITALKLRFEDVALIVLADGDADTVVLRVGDFTVDPEVVLVRVSEEPPWSEMVGLGIRWGWELTNHQGYSDGVRFEFADPNRGLSREIELIVEASTLHLHLCEPINRLPNQPLQPPSGGKIGIE
jgi:hypothetical protein